MAETEIKIINGRKVCDETARKAASGKLPAPAAAEVGQYLRVKAVAEDGTLTLETAEVGQNSGGNVDLPEVSETDNGKFLMVSDGVWAAVSLTNVSEVGA